MLSAFSSSPSFTLSLLLSRFRSASRPGGLRHYFPVGDRASHAGTARPCVDRRKPRARTTPHRIQSAPRRLATTTNFTRVARSLARPTFVSLSPRLRSARRSSFRASVLVARKQLTRGGPCCRSLLHARRDKDNGHSIFNGRIAAATKHAHTRAHETRGEVVRARTVATVATDTVLPPSLALPLRPAAARVRHTNRLTVSGRP